MLTGLHRSLQVVGLLLIALAVVLAGQSGFAVGQALGPLVVAALGLAALVASHLGRSRKPAGGRPGDLPVRGAQDLHRASFLHDDRDDSPLD
jgi:peptidoglycan/LPS O-acetylase OafA/YrhL